jgi:hypothetical protein
VRLFQSFASGNVARGAVQPFPIVTAVTRIDLKRDWASDKFFLIGHVTTGEFK